LAQHYGWAIQQVFDGLDASLPTADRVIILEEDIHTAPDFFSYMKATSLILDQDSSLLAVSAYNDNGHQVKDTHRILRSDFFPGLGWMMTRKLWKEELESKWPPAYWDDWLREPAQRKNRHVLRPEVSRTFHFGDKGGTSRNQFGSILSRVRLNRDAVDWTQQDLSYLHEQPFDEQYGKLLATASLATTIKDAIDRVKTSNIRVEYTSLDEFKRYAEDLDIMKDEKAGIPRTAYKGVIEVRPYDEHILFLTPVTAKLEASFPALAAVET
jgi:alpha-1,3-mannosyl-glycoprotein beta-1,2-N-acetylglucosaminyltransferase